MLRGAIIGAGNVAVHGHLPAWRERREVEIVAAVDVRPSRRQAVSSLLPRARWYDRVETLLAAEALDFVDLSTPPATHAELIRSALGHGLHVLCEKPLVLEPEDLADLSARADQKDRVLYTVHNWSHAPILTKVTELVRSGAIGEVRQCAWQTLRDKPAATADPEAENWRVDPALSGGGILIDHGWHAFYLVAGWVGRAPHRVTARLETRKHVEWPIEDTATVWLEYPSATAEIFLTWASDERRNRVTIQGTSGLIRVDGDTLELFESDPRRPLRRWRFPQSLSEGSHHPDWFGGVASGFLSEVAEPTARGENLAEASLCVTLLALARESSGRGGEPLAVEAARLAKTQSVPERKQWNL